MNVNVNLREGERGSTPCTVPPFVQGEAGTLVSTTVTRLASLWLVQGVQLVWWRRAKRVINVSFHEPISSVNFLITHCTYNVQTL